MKRLSTIFLCVVLMLALCTCAQPQQGETPSLPTEPSQNTAPVETPSFELPQSNSPIKPLPSDPTEEPIPTPTPEPDKIITPGTRQIIAMDTQSGVYLYVEEDGMLFLKHKENGGPVDLGSGLVNYFDPPAEWNAIGQLVISVHGGTGSDGSTRVEIIIDDENSAILSGAVFWNETYQYWSSDSTPNDDPPKPYLSVSPVAQNEDGTMYTRFDLICNGTRIPYNGLSIINGDKSHAIYTGSANLFGDEALELIAVHTISCNEGMHKKEVHVFDGTTLLELDCNGLVETLLNSLSFTRENGAYYISAENFSAAISSYNIPYDEAQLLDQITIGHEVDFRIENNALYAVFPCCIAKDYACYGEIWVALTRSFQRLVPAEYQLRGVGKYTQRSLQTIEIQSKTYQPGNVFGTPVQITMPAVFQITLPGQFRQLDGLGDLCAYNDEGKPATLGDGYVLIRVDKDFVLDETAIQQLQVATSDGVYVENAADGKIAIPAITSAGYEAMYYAPESNPDYINFAYIRIAPEYVLHVYLSKPELIPICNDILDSIVVVDSGSLMFGTKDLASVVKELVEKRQVIPYDYLRYLNQEQRTLAEAYNEQTGIVALQGTYAAINTAKDVFDAAMGCHADYHQDDSFYQLISAAAPLILYRNYPEMIDTGSAAFSPMERKVNSYGKLNYEIERHRAEIESYAPFTMEEYFTLTERLLSSLGQSQTLGLTGIYAGIANCVLNREIISDAIMEQSGQECPELLRQYNEQTLLLKEAYTKNFRGWFDYFHDVDGKICDYSNDPFHNRFLERLSQIVLYQNYSQLSHSDPIVSIIAAFEGGGSASLWASMYHKDWYVGEELAKQVQNYFCLVEDILDQLDDLSMKISAPLQLTSDLKSLRN